jgi:hypothetical protein
VDLSQNQPAISFSGNISHKSGWSFEAGGVKVLQSVSGLERTSFEVGYEHSFTEVIGINVYFKRYIYANDSVNALAGLSNALMLDADFDFNRLTLTISYNHYFGNHSADYFGLGTSSFFKWKQILIIPLAQANFVSQTVEARNLPAHQTGRGKGMPNISSGSTTTTITGLSNLSLLVIFSYPLGNRVRLSVTPSYYYTPTDLSSQNYQFIISAGIRYSIDF